MRYDGNSDRNLLYLVPSVLVIMLAGYFAIVSVLNRGSEAEVVDVVSSYIDNTSSLQWDRANSLLSGEALDNAMKNQGLELTEEKILSSKFIASLNSDFAIVDAVVEKSGIYEDQVEYRFHLNKNDYNWQIYKVEYKDFTRPVLGPYIENNSAMDVLSEYLGLDSKQRRDNAEKYLAGNLLRATLVNRPLYQEQQNEEFEENIITIDPVGSTDDYVTYQAVIETKANKVVTTTFLFDLVEINSHWKIVNIEVLRVA